MLQLMALQMQLSLPFMIELKLFTGVEKPVSYLQFDTQTLTQHNSFVRVCHPIQFTDDNFLAILVPEF